MALQSSGAITFSNLQTEYGGANPISLSEYYKDGTYVPSSITTPAAWTAYTYVAGNTNWTEGPFGTFVNWGGTSQGSPTSGSTSFTAGGYEYQKGTLQSTSSDKYGTTNFYSVRRRSTSGTTTTVNANVPTSGTISMSNFYGGRKT